jgi:hypothetical protein
MFTGDRLLMRPVYEHPLVTAFMASLDRGAAEDRKRRLQEKRARVTPWRSSSSKRRRRDSDR